MSRSPWRSAFRTSAQLTLPRCVVCSTRPLLRPSAAAAARSLLPLRLPAARFGHTIPRPPQNGDDDNDNTSAPATAPADLAPHYELTFTCVPCGARSSHRVSKQGYHHGTVLIACPSCRNRHVIADHLHVFGGTRPVEEILQERGQLIKRGTLGEDGDVELWEDGTESRRQARVAAEGVVQPGAGRAVKGEAGTEGTRKPDAAPGSTFKGENA